MVYDEQQDLTERDFLLACLGLGLFLGWKHLNISPTLFNSPLSDAIATLYQGGLHTLPLFIVVPVLIGFLDDRGIHLPLRPLVAVSATLVSICTAALYAPASDASQLLAALGNACAICSTILLLGWAKLACDRFPLNPLLGSALSFATCFLVAIVGAYAPTVVAIPMHVLLPVASGLILAALNPTSGENDETSSARPGAPSAIPVRLFVGIALVSMCIDLTNMVSETKTTSPDEYTLLITGVIVSCAVVALASMISERTVIGSFKWVLIIVVSSMFFVLIFESEQKVFETATLALGGCLFRVFFYAIVLVATVNTARNRLLVLGIGISIITATQFLDPCVYQAFIATGLSPVVAIALMTVLVIFVVLFVINDHYLASLVSSDRNVFDPSDEAACKRCVSIAAHEHGLTQREEQVALLVLQRKDNTDIASELFIAPSTLQVHMRNIYKKICVHSRTELIDYLESIADVG